MDNKLLEKTRNKLKHDLSSEEQEALKQCSRAINTHTRTGAILGGGLSVYGMYRRKLWPLSKYWGRGLFFGIGGVVVGMQLGLVTASMKCVRIVKALPDPDHVMKALREVQVELQDARRRPLGQSREWSQKGETDHDDEEGGMFGKEGISYRDNQSMPNNDGDENVERPRDSRSSSWDQSPYQDASTGQSMQSAIETLYNGPGPAPSPNGPEAKSRGAVGSQKEQSENIWQQIRGETSNRPETAWDRLRKNGSATAPSKSQQDDGISPFATAPVTSMPDAREAPSKPTYQEDKTLAKDKQQEEFDRLLEQERKGEAEDARRSRNKFGDYS